MTDHHDHHDADVYVVDDVCADVVDDIATLSQLLVPLRCHGSR